MFLPSDFELPFMPFLLVASLVLIVAGGLAVDAANNAFFPALPESPEPAVWVASDGSVSTEWRGVTALR